MYTLINGDCLIELKKLDSNCIDAIITDCPYGISLMQKKWDDDCPKVDMWGECLRVLKPGGHLLAFSGTRTVDLVMGRIREAGFDIRDLISWIYGTGFPKSHNISKGIDKMYGAEREVFGKIERSGPTYCPESVSRGDIKPAGTPKLEYDLTAPSTDAAKQWEGWGTALKPACEPITVARKPFKGSCVKNVLEHGTGAINIDACKVYNNSDMDPRVDRGRWPANVILDEKAGAMLDEQSGVLKGGARVKGDIDPEKLNRSGTSSFKYSKGYESSQGGASRFFYCAKTSKKERNKGLEGMPESQTIGGGGTNNTDDDVCGKYGSIKAKAQNHHPTVKPTALMEYLIKLVTPPNGTVLDPFMGSGSTGVAIKNLNDLFSQYRFIGIEIDSEYFKIAKQRIKNDCL